LNSPLVIVELSYKSFQSWVTSQPIFFVSHKHNFGLQENMKWNEK